MLWAYHRWAVYPCDNITPNPYEHFEIDPKDFARAESMGQIQAIVHSHPDGNAEPSEIDRVQMGVHGLDWVICAFGLPRRWQRVL